jgi:hypothetical protein
MTIPHPPMLFHWQDIESTDDLARFVLVRDNLPDEQLVSRLERARGKGRNDYPVRPMWNLVLAGVVFLGWDCRPCKLQSTSKDAAFSLCRPCAGANRRDVENESFLH